MVIEKLLAHLGNRRRSKRDQCWRASRQLGVDLGGDLCCFVAVGRYLAADGSLAFAEIDPPCAMMQIHGHAPNANAPGPTLLRRRHERLPCTKCAPSVHQGGLEGRSFDSKRPSCRRAYGGGDRNGNGEGGIRTLGGASATPVFETGPIGRSGTSPIPRQARVSAGSPAQGRDGCYRTLGVFVNRPPAVSLQPAWDDTTRSGKMKPR